MDGEAIKSEYINGFLGWAQQRATSLAFSNLLRCLDSYRNIVRLGGTERLNTSSGSFAFCTEQKSPRRLHVNCNGDSNQRWYWSGGHLKSKWRDDCLDEAWTHAICEFRESLDFRFHFHVQCRRISALHSLGS